MATDPQTFYEESRQNLKTFINTTITIKLIFFSFFIVLNIIFVVHVLILKDFENAQP